MPNERQIIKEILGGDKESYRLLVERYQDGLVRYCYSIVQDEAGAVDASQQAFINAYQNLNKYKPKYAFSTWLYRIARNESLREYKRLRKNSPIENSLADRDEMNLTKEIEKIQDAEHLKSAMSKLRHDWRSTLHFYYWEGKTYEEIAQLMDKPVNTIRVWLNRAKKQLEEELS